MQVARSLFHRVRRQCHASRQTIKRLPVWLTNVRLRPRNSTSSLGSWKNLGWSRKSMLLWNRDIHGDISDSNGGNRPDHERSNHFRNSGKPLPLYTAQQPRRQPSLQDSWPFSQTPPPHVAQWSVPRSGRFSFRERPLDIKCTAWWTFPTSSWDILTVCRLNVLVSTDCPSFLLLQ
jgi:hypothetical protein